MTCRILVPWPGIKPITPSVEAQNPNHCTAMEVHWKIFIDIILNSLILSLACLVYWWSTKVFFVSHIVLFIPSILNYFAEFLSLCLYYQSALAWGQVFPFLTLIVVILNFQFNNSKISAISKFGFDGSLVSQMLKNLPSMQETLVRSPGWEDPLEKGMATHSSILSWRIPWTEEPGGLQDSD